MSKCYYVVDSIKGGCGKTTFSIMLAQFFQKINEDRKNKERVCLLDFDFLGTGLSHLFFAESIDAKLSVDYEYITKIIRGFDIEDKKYLYDCIIGSTPFLVGFGDPNYRRKEAYYISSKLNYTPAIHYGIFRDGIQRILKKGFEDQLNETVESVVLDMSPGMDAYSQIVKDCLFDKRYSTFLDNEDKRYYFLMTGADNSQLHATANYFQEFMDSEDKTPDRIFIVLNDWLGLATADGSTGTEDAIRELYDAWILEFKNSVTILEKDKEKIYFLIPHYFRKYWLCTHKRDALVSVGDDSEIFETLPFRYWKEWEENTIKEVRAEECIEMFAPDKTVRTRGALLKCLKE